MLIKLYIRLIVDLTIVAPESSHGETLFDALVLANLFGPRAWTYTKLQPSAPVMALCGSEHATHNLSPWWKATWPMSRGIPQFQLKQDFYGSFGLYLSPVQLSHTVR